MTDLHIVDAPIAPAVAAVAEMKAWALIADAATAAVRTPGLTPEALGPLRRVARASREAAGLSPVEVA